MLKYTKLRWSSAEQLGTPATDTTIPAQLLKCYKHSNWSTLEKMRIRTRIIFLYKIIHHLIAIYPTNVLTQSDPRTRQYPHSYSYRLIQTTNDSYKYSYFRRTIAQRKLLPVVAVQCTTRDSFRE
jgi:hypothetical protein